jgi:hypothetical protein
MDSAIWSFGTAGATLNQNLLLNPQQQPHPNVRAPSQQERLSYQNPGW